MFESSPAKEHRVKLETDPMMPTIDLDALDSVILELAYYDPFQSPRDIVDHLIDNELVSDRLSPHSITAKLVVDILEPYVKELKTSLLSHMGERDVRPESQQDVSFVCYKRGWYVLGIH